MAEHAMPPEQALHAIAHVRHERELLTARATGQIWMLWGLVLGLIGFASQAAFHAAYAGGWVDPLFIVLGGGIGAAMTNATWRAHALEHDPRHRAWVAWALGIGGLMTVGMLVLLSNLVDLGPDPTLQMAPIPLVGALAAATITVATRHRVSPLAGWAAAALLLGVFAFARFVQFAERTPSIDFLGNMALNTANIVAFTVVGWIHFRRG